MLNQIVHGTQKPADKGMSRRDFLRKTSTIGLGAALSNPLFAVLAYAGWDTVVHEGIKITSEKSSTVSKDIRQLDYIISTVDNQLKKIRPRNESEKGTITLKTIHRTINRKRYQFKCNFLSPSDCKNSYIYIAVGDALNLPIKGVIAPHHIFVRYHPNDGKYINWEVSQRRSLPDSHYMKNHDIPQESIDNGAYLRSLSSQEILGCLYKVGGNVKAAKRMFHKAMEYYNKGIELHPTDPSIYYEKAVTYFNQGAYQDAIKNFTKAINLNPRYAKAFYGRGFSWKQAGNRNNASKDRKMALKLNPKLIKKEKRY